MADITALPTAHNADAAKKAGPSVRVSVAVVLLGAIIAIPAAIKAAVPILHTFATSQAYDTPATIHRHLTRGHYELFQEAGSAFSPGSTTLEPREVRVTETGGTEVAVGPVSGSERITRGSTSYEAAVGFTIDHAADYDIRVINQDNGRIIVARSFGDLFREVGRWLLVFGLGGLLAVIGTAMGIVGAVRRSSRARRPMAIWPPSGWYADPSGAARLRYWDGHSWTEHFDR